MGIRSRKELQRTCQRDGTVWFVPTEMSKPPSKQAIVLRRSGPLVGRAFAESGEQGDFSISWKFLATEANAS